MALVLELGKLDGLKNENAEWLCHFKFRDAKKESKPATGKATVDFGDCMVRWSLARRIDEDDQLLVKVYRHGFRSSLFAKTSVWLHKFKSEVRQYQFVERLIDPNNKQLPVSISFRLSYLPPDSHVADVAAVDLPADGLSGDPDKASSQHPWKLDQFKTVSYDSKLEDPEKAQRPFVRFRKGPSNVAESESLLQPHLKREDDEEQEDVKLLRDKYSKDLMRSKYGLGGGADSGFELDENELGKLKVATSVSSVKNMTRVPQTVMPSEDFQLVVTIVDGRKIEGSNPNPYIFISCAGEERVTEIQFGTSTPYFNQVYVIDFNMPSSQILDQVLVLTAYSKSEGFFGKFHKGTLIGEFRIDVRTVYTSPGHFLHGKWAVLMDPKNPDMGPRGFIRCHIYLIRKGEQLKFPEERVEGDDDEDMHLKNLILPLEKSGSYQLAELSMKIYEAEDLPAMNTDLVSTIKTALLGDDAMIDPFVEVTFAGYTESTKRQSSTYHPHWNEEVVFIEKFPSLCTRIMVSLVDWGLRNERVATHFIELDQIMDASSDESGFLPTFGPTWVPLYGRPRNYTFDNWVNYDQELNLGLGEGVAYRGRLLLAIKSKITDSRSRVGVARRKTPTINLDDFIGPKEEWTLMCFPFEVNAISNEYSGTALSFEVSCGTYGNSVDGKVRTQEELLLDTRRIRGDIRRMREQHEDENKDAFAAVTEVLSDPCYHSRSVPLVPVPASADGQYHCLPIRETVECLFVRVLWEDFRTRMFVPNMIDKMIDFLEASIASVMEDVDQANRQRGTSLETANATLVMGSEKLQGVCKHFQGLIQNGMREYSNVKQSGKKTTLFVRSLHNLKVTFEKIRQKAEKIRSELLVEFAAQDSAMPIDVQMEEAAAKNAEQEVTAQVVGGGDGGGGGDAADGAIQLKGQSPESAIKKTIQSRAKVVEETARDDAAAKQKQEKRLAKLKKAMKESADRAKQVRHEMKVQVIESRLREVRAFLVILRRLRQSPSAGLPDIFVWLLNGEKRVAYARIPAREVLYSQFPSFIGKHCNYIQTLYLRKPGRENVGKNGWSIVCQANMCASLDVHEEHGARLITNEYMWMGLSTEVGELKQGLPDGYNIERDRFQLPKAIKYMETSYFQCRAYLYMSRNLIATDSTGLSDPFARILIRNRVMRTRTASTTLNPIWDQTCVLEWLQFYMSPEMLKEKTAPIVVELFDFDDMLEFNFLGRTLVFPYVITFANKDYLPPKLEWWTIYRNQKRAGELLAAIELIELRDATEELDESFGDETVDKKYTVRIPGLTNEYTVPPCYGKCPNLPPELEKEPSMAFLQRRDTHMEEETLLPHDWVDFASKAPVVREVVQNVNEVGTQIKRRVKAHMKKDELDTILVEEEEPEQKEPVEGSGQSNTGSDNAPSVVDTTDAAARPPSAAASGRPGSRAASAVAPSASGTMPPAGSTKESVQGGAATIEKGVGGPVAGPFVPEELASGRPMLVEAWEKAAEGFEDLGFLVNENLRKIDYLKNKVKEMQRPLRIDDSLVDYVIPRQVKPRLGKYRLEVLFWGMRALRPIIPLPTNLFAVKHPHIEVDWAGYRLKSSEIENAVDHPNFIVRVERKVVDELAEEDDVMAHFELTPCLRHFNIELPENDAYWPPLQIRAIEHSTFGYENLIGVRVVPNPHAYFMDEEALEERERTLKALIDHLTAAERAAKALLEKKQLPKEEDAFRVSEIGEFGNEPNKRRLREEEKLKQYKEAAKGKRELRKRGAEAGGALRDEDLVDFGPLPGEEPPLPKDVETIENQGVAAGGAAGAAAGAARGAPPPRNQPGKVVKKKYQGPQLTKKDLEDIDWWSKYYATIDWIVDKQDKEKEAQEKEKEAAKMRRALLSEAGAGEDPAQRAKRARKRIEVQLRELKLPRKRRDMGEFFDGGVGAAYETDEVSIADPEEVLEGIQVDVKSEDESDVMEVPDAEVSERKRKKKKRKKFLWVFPRRPKKPISKRAMGAYRKEVTVDMADASASQDSANRSKSIRDLLCRTRIYDTKLENIGEFDLFSWAHTYPLFSGTENDNTDAPPEEDKSRLAGIFKGNLMIYNVDEEEFRKRRLASYREYKLAAWLPPILAKALIVRVYIVRALDLHPKDLGGSSDPYLVVRLGDQVRNDRDNFQPCNLRPTFGKVFEFEVTFPTESLLTVGVMDHDNFKPGALDDLIGETTIDLENRLYNRHYAQCGLQQQYEVFGYNKWRDSRLPTKILEDMCSEFGPRDEAGKPLLKPKYEVQNNRVVVGTAEFYGPVEIIEESGKTKPSREPLALEALKGWHKVPNIGVHLVPEHVETRPLFLEDMPGIEQGRVQMWVDLFVKEVGLPPPPVDISPRKPESYQLRVIVWNTGDTKLTSENFLTGDKFSDIFVRGWLNGNDIDKQDTDVHYLCMDGTGMFNWRFVFELDYMRAEDKLRVKHPESLLGSSDDQEITKPCVLMLQCWDAQLIGADNFIGSLEMRLSKLPLPAHSSGSCGMHQLLRDPKIPQINFFTLPSHRLRGWYPFKDKDYEEDEKADYCKAKVDIEMHLITKEDAEGAPVGKGRDEPEPLEKPSRPSIDIFKLLNPLRILKHFFLKYKWIILKVFLLLLLVLLIALFIYTFPGAISSKIINIG